MRALRLWTTSELYPPETPADIKAALAVLLNEKDLEGRALLRRSLAEAERAALRARSRALDPWIVKPREGEIEPLLLELSVGLQNRSENDEEAAIRVSHYAEILADTPLWAIKRACDRFDRGEVSHDELGERLPLLRGRFPSTAHLYRIASAIARPVFHERVTIHEALNGVVARSGPSTPEERAEVEAARASFNRTVGGLSELEEAKRQLASESVRHATERLRAAEFRRAGLEPPAGSMVSLAMMLRLGWTIIDGPGGKKALLRQRAAKPPAPEPEPKPKPKSRDEYRREYEKLDGIKKTARVRK
jgi:hypothetical protein